MNYPYDLSKFGELERYTADFRKEPLKIQEEIRQGHLKMAEACRNAANELSTFDYRK